MFVYLLPLFIFIVSIITLYYISTDKEKSKPNKILLRNVLPSIVISLLVFVVIKYRDSELFNPEPLMGGNYFD
jgi:RsiW-degrading membrane proteinase PrsW (M82 family)